MAQQMSQRESEHRPVPYTLYFGVWAALIVLTAITVGVSYVDLKHVTVLTAMVIASIKATLVVMYFMHVRFERPLYAAMILAALGTYAVFFGLTFSDYLYR